MIDPFVMCWQQEQFQTCMTKWYDHTLYLQCMFTLWKFNIRIQAVCSGFFHSFPACLSVASPSYSNCFQFFLTSNLLYRRLLQRKHLLLPLLRLLFPKLSFIFLLRAQDIQEAQSCLHSNQEIYEACYYYNYY